MRCWKCRPDHGWLRNKMHEASMVGSKVLQMIPSPKQKHVLPNLFMWSVGSATNGQKSEPNHLRSLEPKLPVFFENEEILFQRASDSLSPVSPSLWAIGKLYCKPSKQHSTQWPRRPRTGGAHATATNSWGFHARWLAFSKLDGRSQKHQGSFLAV